MKRKFRRTIELVLTVCIILTFSQVCPILAYAVGDLVFITDSMNAADIESDIQNIINAAPVNGNVTVDGSKVNEKAELNLNIPVGVTVIWEAISKGLSLRISGGGTFEVAGNGKIEVAGTAVRADYGNVTVSGGEVLATGDYCAAIEVIRGNVKVTGGTVSANMGIGHCCYAICIGDPWNPSGTVTITGGNVTARSMFGDSFAISLQNGGLAACLAGTCDGDFEVWGAGIIVKAESLDVSPLYGGTADGLAFIAGGSLADVRWDLSGTIPVISFKNGQRTVEWAAPETAPEGPPAEYPVKLVETGDSFDTLNAAIAAAKNDGYSTFTLEITGNVTESGAVVIGSEDVTIVGSGGKYTVTDASFKVNNGGSLTLGDDTDANTTAFLGSVHVTDGTVKIKDGTALSNSANYPASFTLLLSGSAANGEISGGRIEGNIAVGLEKGARISEISGGVFTGITDTVHLTDAGTKIETISGGVFYQTDPDVKLHGSVIFVQNYAKIDEISGGYFDAARNSAMVLIRGGKVGEISGGEFVAHRTGTIKDDNRNAAIWVENGWSSEGFIGTGIDTISGGHIRGTNFGLLLIADYGYCYVNQITGGTFEGTVALQNDRGSSIAGISGGTFTGSQGILNVSKIGTIGGQAEIHGTDSYGIYNYSRGQIDEINGGTIVSGKDHGIANSGTIKLISGGTIIGYRSAIHCDGLNKGNLEVINNGVFWGKNGSAIVLAYPLALEPGLSEDIGFGRYWGKDGKIFNNENLVNYPDGYWMSEDTKLVAGIADAEFKYLTNGREPVVYSVTFDTNDGAFSDSETTAERNVVSPETSVGAENMPVDPARSGYTFSGWNTEQDGSGEVFTGDTPVDGDVTVYAQWIQNDGGDADGGDTDGGDTDGGDADGGDTDGGNAGAGRPGGEASGPNPPSVGVGEEEIPLSPFITDHVAYISGYPDGTVGPNRNITRAEVATIFFRLLTDEVRAEYRTQDNPFSDVQRGMWYNNAVSVMHNMGIIQGYPDATFRPDKPITRAELAAVAARFAREMRMHPINDLLFNDISGHWAETDISHAAAIGWVNGYPDGAFKPNRYITRAEVIALVNRMLEREPEIAEDLLEDEMIVWPDNIDKNMWYYFAVQEATNSHKPEHKDKTVPGLQFRYEYWVEIIPNFDWTLLEKN